MWNPPILVLLLAIGLVRHHVSGQPPTQPTYYYKHCGPPHDDYDYDTEYESNVKTVLVVLQDQGLTSPFYSTSAGSGVNAVYGQYLCRGDIDSRLCGQCIHETSQSLLDECSSSAAAVMLYEECTLRYANRPTVEVEADFPDVDSSSPDKVPDPDRFGEVLGSVMDKIINKAAYGKGSLRFATGEGVVSESRTVYCLVQCSPLFNGSQCERCLRSAYRWVPEEWVEWVFMFYQNCHLRYNTTAFYTLPNAPPGSPPNTTPGSPRPPRPKGKEASYYIVTAVIPSAVVGVVILLAVFFYLIKRKRASKSAFQSKRADVGGLELHELPPTDCIQFDLKTIHAATKSFSLTNKLGQGGFGIVYKGILKNGQDIAVKRLSKNSGQGSKEFKTEVAVLAKLQHKNLVRLVGCCADGEERLLVYEFLPNLSLDRFLFDVTRSTNLTWAIRHKSIQGIARGLHYLHEDSRFKIVHRDLKTSNILLDDNLDPKIADFGMARLVKVDQTVGNTTKVVGTFGYMAPEYALAGRYSTKSDVYSFGVIVLEILSGKCSSVFYEMSHGEGLLHYAWRMWNEGTIEQVMDHVLQNNFSRTEAERCLQIGLLCVQDDAANRPTMHAVLVMLNSNTIDLPPPFSPSQSNYINKLSYGDKTQERKEHETESSLSSTTICPQKDLYAR